MSSHLRILSSSISIRCTLGTLFQEADAKKRGVDVVALTQSPKNIGEANNQFMWYAKGSNAAGSPSFKILTREDGNWPQLANEIKDWLNKYVPPHMLISVSIFHDVHDEESDNNKIHACIAHSAGANPADLSKNEAAKTTKSIYDLQTIEGSGEWEDMFD